LSLEGFSPGKGVKNLHHDRRMYFLKDAEGALPGTAQGRETGRTPVSGAFVTDDNRHRRPKRATVTRPLM